MGQLRLVAALAALCILVAVTSAMQYQALNLDNIKWTRLENTPKEVQEAKIGVVGIWVVADSSSRFSWHLEDSWHNEKTLSSKWKQVDTTWAGAEDMYGWETIDVGPEEVWGKRKEGMRWRGGMGNFRKVSTGWWSYITYPPWGREWRMFSNGYKKDVVSIAQVYKNKAWVVNKQGDAYYSADDGKTWAIPADKGFGAIPKMNKVAGGVGGTWGLDKQGYPRYRDNTYSHNMEPGLYWKKIDNTKFTEIASCTIALGMKEDGTLMARVGRGTDKEYGTGWKDVSPSRFTAKSIDCHGRRIIAVSNDDKVYVGDF